MSHTHSHTHIMTMMELEDDGAEDPYTTLCRRHLNYTPRECVATSHIPHPPPLPPPPCFICQPDQMAFPSGTSGMSEVQNGSDQFVVRLDMQQFQPSEIQVKATGNTLVIHARHDERSDGSGTVSRELTRKYVLPKNVEPTTLTSSLASNGTLTIRAPKQQVQPKEHVIPITQEMEETEHTVEVSSTVTTTTTITN